VPVLARTLEAAGLSTILVSNMPFWAEKVGTPRTLAVEHPFAHTLGQPGDRAGQTRVIHAALDTLASAAEPGTIAHYPETWPVDVKEATQSWQPEAPSPIIRVMGPRIREILRERRRKARA
jgi:hypothetical protein